MTKTLTHGIEISVECKYWPEQSSPKDNLYFFIYYITITNKSAEPMQLIKRHWDIFDSVNEKRMVDGIGVVGETPVIEPGEKYEYNSGCNLVSEIGFMKGFYTMKKINDGAEVDVEIPQFNLIVPAKLN
ncbi:MAG: Co2+/Mg2+ efflux protein ApaG [Bacteroidia bacterium]|nr:Co2+/Mg2+ efflux protein ApaG [Bacteroidia bacterium]